MPSRDQVVAAESAPGEAHIVIFQLGDEHYGLDIQSVQEIVRMQSITSIPGTDAFVLGITNLRGRVVPVLDMRIRCGKAAAETTAASRIVVVMSDDGGVGLAVDAVTEVMRIPAERIELPGQLAGLPSESIIRGIAKLPDRLVSLLDLARVLGRPGEGIEELGAGRAAA